MSDAKRGELNAAQGTIEELIRARLAEAIGGWRGSIELMLPTVTFVVLWTITRDVRVAAGASLGIAVVLGAVALIQRSSLRQVLGAVAGTAIAAWFATRSGRAEAAFLPGILLNAAYAVGAVISILVRFPLVGFLVGLADPTRLEDPFGWRRDRAMVAVCTRLTWVLLAMYLIRVAVMFPLYQAQQVAWLGVAKVVLGWPLWVAVIAIMGAMLVRGRTPLDEVRVATRGSADQPAQEHPEP